MKYTTSFVLLLASVASAQATRHVPASYATIESAVDAAQDGDTVLVAPGTYPENNIYLNGKKIHIKSSGGADVTTIDGDHVSRIFRFNGGETYDTVLEGFTLLDGQAPTGGGTAGDGGGAILFQNSSPWIKNCVFFSCEADDGSAATSTGGTGYRGGHGGAVYLINSDVRFESCSFRFNYAGKGGDGKMGQNGTQGSFFSPTGTAGKTGGNGGRGGFGGAAYVDGNSAPTFVNCFFRGNRAGSGGRGAPGGLGGPGYLDLIFGFTGAGGRGGNGGRGGQGGDGGAIYASSPARISVVNCTLTGHSLAPGGIYGVGAPGGSGTSTGATGSNGSWGSAAANGLIYAAGSSNVSMLNSIAWDNELPSFTGVNVDFSSVQVDPGGIGNIEGDPLLEQASEPELSASSPCIDAGSANLVPTWVTHDIVGVPRALDNPNVPDTGFGPSPLVDMGAQEFAAAYALRYGCGVNPSGSLTIVSGQARIDQTVTFGITNPTGGQAAGALPVLLFSVQPPANACGIQVPGFGMAGPGAPGALLLGVDIDGYVGSPWAGPGTTAQMAAPIPDVAGLIGVSIYTQGALVGGGGVGLTDAIELIVGP